MSALITRDWRSDYNESAMLKVDITTGWEKDENGELSLYFHTKEKHLKLVLTELERQNLIKLLNSYWSLKWKKT